MDDELQQKRKDNEGQLQSKGDSFGDELRSGIDTKVLVIHWRGCLEMAWTHRSLCWSRPKKRKSWTSPLSVQEGRWSSGMVARWYVLRRVDALEAMTC